MKKRVLSFLILVSMLVGLLAGIGSPAIAAFGETSIVKLKVNNLEEPLGVDFYPLEFGWEMVSNVIGQAQSAYQIQVARDKAFSSITWDSGKVSGCDSVGILSNGAFLAETDYYWRVFVTDAWGNVVVSDIAHFSTGLASWTDRSVWEGAQLIGSNNHIAYDSAFQTMGYAEITFQIVEGDNFSFIFNADDFRFTDKGLNPFNSPGGENFIRVEIDTSEITASANPGAKYAIYRVGFDQTDAINGDPNIFPYKWGRLPASGNGSITNANKNSDHRIAITISEGGVCAIALDGTNLPTSYDNMRASTRAAIGTAIATAAVASLPKVTLDYLAALDPPVTSTADIAAAVGRRPGLSSNNVAPNLLYPASATGAFTHSTGGNFGGWTATNSLGFQVAKAGDKVEIKNIRINERNNASASASNREVFSVSRGSLAIYADAIGVTLNADGTLTLNGTEANAGVPQYRNPSNGSEKYMRTEFTTANKAIDNVKIYATSMGGNTMHVNGSRIGEDWFNPGLTKYRDYLNYNTYDVTELVNRNGGNAWGVEMGVGFGVGRMNNGGYNQYSNESGFMAKLVVTYADGSRQTIVTNTTDWQVCTDGPVTYTDNYQGFSYNANNEKNIEGWAEPGFVDAYGVWRAPQTIVTGHNANAPFSAVKIVARRDQPVRVANTRTAQRVLATHLGVAYTYDMGSAMTGVPSITIPAGSLKEGDRVAIRSAEEIYPGNADRVDFDGNEVIWNFRTGALNTFNVAVGDPQAKYVDMYGPAGGFRANAAGTLQYDTNRGAMASDLYIASKEDETRDVVFQPRDTFHGYRYISISIPNRAEPLPLDNVKGLELSSIAKPINYFEAVSTDTSAQYPFGRTAALHEQFFKNTLQSQFGNFISIPTDCPQRNERQGWTGDLQAYARTATYHSIDTQNFLRQWNMALSAELSLNGAMGNTCPTNGMNPPSNSGSNSTIVWGGAMIQAPWQLYMQYNDMVTIRENYSYMKTYIDGSATPYTSVTSTYPYLTTANNLSDHIGLEGNTSGGNGSCLLQNCLLIYLVRGMSVLAEEMGDTAYAASLRVRHDLMVDSWNRCWVDPNTGMTLNRNPSTGALTSLSQNGVSNNFLDTQSTYAYALFNGVVSDTMTVQAGPNAGMTYKEFFAKRLAEVIASPASCGNGRGAMPNSAFVLATGGNYMSSNRPYTITTGFAATPALLPALTMGGNNEAAYKIFSNTEYATWLYPVQLGATTQWELWDGFDRAFMWAGGSGMNSFNHFALGASVQWVYEYMMGITTGDEAGYQDYILQPSPGGNYTSMQGGFESNYGFIKSDWTAKGNGDADTKGVALHNNELLTFSPVIPANTTVTLYLPVDEADMADFENIPGVYYLGMAEHNGQDCAKFRLLSGGYEFEVTADGLVASYADGYVVPDVLYEAVLAKIHANEDSVILNDTASYTVSLSEAKGLGVFELSFKFDGEILDKDSINVALKNGFTYHLLSPAPVFTYLGSGWWKCTVKLMYFNNIKTSDQLEAFVISGKAIDYGAAVVTLSGFSAQGDNGAGMGVMPSLIHTPEATVTVGAKPPVYSKYDLNKDGVVNETDLLYLIYFYQWNDRDPGWATDGLYDVFAKDCDFQVNGKVDLADMIELTANYGAYDPYDW